MKESLKSIIAFLVANKHRNVADVLPAVTAMCEAMSIDSVKLPVAESALRAEVGDQGRTDREEVVQQMVAAFAQKKNVHLIKKGRSRFCDETGERLQVYCAFSKRYENGVHFWYTIMDKPLRFLQKAQEGYLLFGMAGEPNVIFLNIKDFADIKEQLNPHQVDGRVEGRHVHINKTNGEFEIKLKGRGQSHDLSENLLDLS